MMKKINQLFNGIPMTIAAGIFLAVSLILMLSDRRVMIDPAWFTVVICGFPLLYLAITRLIVQKWVSSALLISIAMIASIGIGEMFAAGEVAFIMAVGAILEDKTVAKAKQGLTQLMKLTPQQGRRITGTGQTAQEEMIPADQINRGDILRVLPGEAIPVDGDIIMGNTSIDQSIITGESLPVDKGAGDEVYCGTMNQYGVIEIRASKVGEDSSLQKLIRLVADAEKNQAPMQRIADQWATWLVPIALAIAVITFLCFQDITRAVTILVVFCPCALALATPTSIMAAIGQAAKYGVIIKSGEALEKMGRVDYIAFDKTGTLTFGDLHVCDILSFDAALTDRALLQLAASAEQYSEHPLAKALVAAAKEKELPLLPAQNFEILPGRGIRAEVSGSLMWFGSSTFLQENGFLLTKEMETSLEALRCQGKAMILIARQQKCIGAAALSDTVRPTAGEMIDQLTQLGTGTVLLTGDHAQSAEYLAAQVGITDVHSELLPEQKVAQLKNLQASGYRVCMIGDGVNDAPALKTADVGVAMASIGSEIAIDAADIALMGDEIEKIPYLKRLSNATLRTIKFNISLSMLINLVAITLSVLGILGPISGALVHNAGSVLVVLNAALLYDRKYMDSPAAKANDSAALQPD